MQMTEFIGWINILHLPFLLPVSSEENSVLAWSNTSAKPCSSYVTVCLFFWQSCYAYEEV